MSAQHPGEEQPFTEGGGEPPEAHWHRFLRLQMDVCPNCGAEMGPGVCCNMSWTEWHCFGCGANLDSRVAMPKVVMRCEDEWPDYERHILDPVHPLACSCTGRGWHEWPSEVTT